MEEEFTLTEFNIVDVLDEIRKPNGNKKSNTKTFEDIVPFAWKKLGLEGTPNPVALEKLLVNLILDIYDVEKAENNDKKRVMAQNRDVSLLMFGLLDGYYHTEEKNGKKVNIPSEERYERYLNDGYFIKLDYLGEGTYQEIKIKDKKRKTKSNSAQPRPLNKLTKIAGKCRYEIGGKLFELIKAESYKQYIGELQGADNADTSIDLPNPYYTLENFSPISEPKSGPTGNLEEDSIPDQPNIINDDITPIAIQEKIVKLIEYLRIQFRTKDVIAILILLFMAATTWEIAQTLRNTEKSQQQAETVSNMSATESETLTITGITIYNADITLAPDKTWEHLQVGIYPREANIDDVQYGSENTHLVVVDRAEEVVVQLASEWQREIERSTNVHAQFREIDAKALVTIQENPIADSTDAPSESSLEGNDSANTERVSGF